jgi:hypothetical protein
MVSAKGLKWIRGSYDANGRSRWGDETLTQNPRFLSEQSRAAILESAPSHVWTSPAALRRHATERRQPHAMRRTTQLHPGLPRLALEHGQVRCLTKRGGYRGLEYCGWNDINVEEHRTTQCVARYVKADLPHRTKPISTMKNGSSEFITLHKAAEEIVALLAVATERCLDSASMLSSEIDSIQRMTPLSESVERDMALEETMRVLHDAEQAFNEFKTAAGWALWHDPVRRWKLWQSQRDARSEHERAEAIFQSEQERRTRTERIEAHNLEMQRQVNRLPSLRASLEAACAMKQALGELRKRSEQAIKAARGDGWLAPSFGKTFHLMTQAIRTLDIQLASQYLEQLLFQCQPSQQAYDAMTRDSASDVADAYATYSGYAAAGAYENIAHRSIALARPALKVQAQKELDRLSYPADQWQLLAHLLADPRKYTTDAMWAVYWTMFRCSQALSSSLASADAHEDFFTGELSGHLKSEVARFTADRLSRFGYPKQPCYLGLLQSASMREEGRLGADIGVIVDIDIGNLTCRKVALLQAKKAVDGFAEIGSSGRQLAKLSANPNMGFYMFYHQANAPVRSPGPTVCSAQEIAKWAVASGNSVDAEHLRVNLRERGWDWANFMSFGLCRADSHVGAPFQTASDALEVLSGGDSGRLPRFLHVMAIADEPRVRSLEAAIKGHYLPMLHHRSQHKDIGSSTLEKSGKTR